MKTKDDIVTYEIEVNKTAHERRNSYVGCFGATWFDYRCNYILTSIVITLIRLDSA